jgi:exodeoxyribonuclease VII large subunit
MASRARSTRPAAVGADADDRTVTVGELGALIEGALAAGVPERIWVRGELSRFKKPNARGHTYFDLVEKDAHRPTPAAVIGCALFQNRSAAVFRACTEAGVELADGVEIRVRGKVDYYPPFGRLQLIVDAVDPVFTIGKLSADRDRVLRVLAAEGLLEVNGRLPFPLVPLQLGLVTSAGSAADHDFCDELDASGWAFRVVRAHAQVQGAGADTEIVAALRRLARLDLDAVAVVRGGGARTDLAAFDAETVARAIAAMPVPVVTGIGHEIDRTVADAVAHTFAKTPTAAAGVFIGAVGGFAGDLGHLAHRVAGRARSLCTVAGRDLDARHRRVVDLARAGTRGAAQGLGARERGIVVAARRALAVGADRVEDRAARVAPVARRAVREARRDLATVEVRVRALDPQRVLERGYSITRADDGRVVRAADDVTPGTTLVTEVRAGTITSTVVAAAPHGEPRDDPRDDPRDGTHDEPHDAARAGQEGDEG